MEKQEELWRPVVGHEDFYEVSNWGRVKSQSRRGTKGGILKPQPSKKSYLKVGLYKNGEKETCLVHILVMRAFKGECPEGFEVDHYDWNPSNNKLENLSYQPKEINRARKSPEWLNNTAEAAKKRAQDHEWLRKTSEANRRKAQDPEWRKSHAQGTRKACCKPVNQYSLDGQFVKRWPSAADAERGLGVHHQKISACCKGRQKTAYGYIWRYAEPC